MANLTEKTIAALSDPKSFERGMKYYHQGRVSNYRENDNELEATVLGTREYNVAINLADLDMSCDCPFAEIGNVCKHIVAVLLTKVHGEVIPANKPKAYISSAGSDSDNDFNKQLFSMSKEDIIDRLREISWRMPEIKKYFPLQPKSPDPAYYKALEKKICLKIRKLGPEHYYDDYWGKQEETCFEILILLQSLPYTDETLTFLLKQAQWINEELSEVDDSNGILRELVADIAHKIVRITDALGLDALGRIYEFTALKSSADFYLDIVFELLMDSEKPEIVASLMDKLEKTRHKIDPDFAFDRKSGLKILLDYYRINHDARYEDLAEDLINTDILAKLDFIRFLEENQRYGEVLKYGWEIRSHYDICISIENALRQLGDRRKLIKFYKEQLETRFDKDYFKKLKREFSESGENQKWNNYVRTLIGKIHYLPDLLEMLMLLERYDDIYQLLIQNTKNGAYGHEGLLIEYAAKFTIVNPLMAVKFYRLLLENEVGRIGKSNYYKRLMEFWGELEELNDRDYLAQIKRQLMISNPTKKKLIELLVSK